MAITFTVAYPGSAYPGEDPFLIDGTDPGPTSVTIDNENPGAALGTQINWPYGPAVACTVTITSGSAEELALIRIGMVDDDESYILGSGGIYSRFSSDPPTLEAATAALQVGDVIGLKNNELQYKDGYIKLNGAETYLSNLVGSTAIIEQTGPFGEPPASEFWTGFNQSYEVP